MLAGVADAATGVAAPVRAGGELVGVLLAAGRQTATPALLDVLEAIAATAGQVILNGRLIDQVAGRNAERDFLDALVDGEEPEAVLVARARRLGIELAEQHVAVVFAADPAAGDPDGALARVRDAVLAAFPGSACAVRGLQAIALLRVRDETQLAARLERAARGKVAVAVGLSRARTGGQGHAEGFDEAAQAVRMGAALHGPAAVTRFDDLGVQRYLWSLAQEPARDVWQERLERLRVHDARARVATVRDGRALPGGERQPQGGGGAALRPPQHAAAAVRPHPAGRADRPRRPGDPVRPAGGAADRPLSGRGRRVDVYSCLAPGGTPPATVKP